MISRIFSTKAMALAFLVGAVHPSAAAEFTIYGAGSITNSILAPFEHRIEKRAGVDIEFHTTGTRSGLLELMHGDAQLVAITAKLHDAVHEINQAQPGSVDARELMAHQIGTTKVAFIVHPSNPVKELTFKQITDILSGRTKFWNQVGGNSLPIDVVIAGKGVGIRTLVEHHLGEWGDVIVPGSQVQSTRQVTFAVTQLPNAIGVVTLAEVTNDVFMLRSDETIEVPFYLVTRGQPDGRQMKVIQAVRAIGIGDNGGA